LTFSLPPQTGRATMQPLPCRPARKTTPLPAGRIPMRRCLFASLLCTSLTAPAAADEPAAKGPADLIVHHAHIVTLDGKSQVFEALAAKDGRIIALGDDETVFKLAGPKTRTIDAESHTVLPGLYDSHMHPVSAALSELAGPLPDLRSLKDVFAYIRKQAESKPEGDWIVLPY